MQDECGKMVTIMAANRHHRTARLWLIQAELHKTPVSVEAAAGAVGNDNTKKRPMAGAAILSRFLKAEQRGKDVCWQSVVEATQLLQSTI